MGVWTSEDRAAARKEGWGLFDVDEPGEVRLQRLDPWQAEGVSGCAAWVDDTDVWEYVMADTSPLHQKAVGIVRDRNPEEYRAMRRWVTCSERPIGVRPKADMSRSPVHEKSDGRTINGGRGRPDVPTATVSVGRPVTGTWLAEHPAEAAVVAGQLEDTLGPAQAARLLERADGDRFFAVWLTVVDHWAEEEPPGAVPSRFPWRAAYEQGLRPHEAVSTARDLGHSPVALEDFGLIENAAEWRAGIG
jgi:hypothetical protein